MPGAGLSWESSGKAPPERLALKPYWGKPTVRNFRGGDGDVGIIRSPVRAITLPDPPGTPATLTEVPIIGHTARLGAAGTDYWTHGPARRRRHGEERAHVWSGV